jgi:hypothetical protein
MQNQGENIFILRFFLAATLASNYGMYGPVYEFYDIRLCRGKEEYYDSEKYEGETSRLEEDNPDDGHHTRSSIRREKKNPRDAVHMEHSVLSHRISKHACVPEAN